MFFFRNFSYSVDYSVDYDNSDLHCMNTHWSHLVCSSVCIKSAWCHSTVYRGKWCKFATWKVMERTAVLWLKMAS